MKRFPPSFVLVVAATIISEIWLLKAHQGWPAELAVRVTLFVGPFCLLFCPVMHFVVDEELPSGVPRKLFAAANLVGTFAGLGAVIFWLYACQMGQAG